MISHVLFVAQSAATDAVARRHLARQGYAIDSADPTRAVAAARQRLPDLIVWSGDSAALEAGFRDFRLLRATWNIPIVQLGGADEPCAALSVEPDLLLATPREGELADGIAGAVSARDRRLAEGVHAELRLQLPSGLDQLERLGRLMTEWFALCGLKAYQARQTVVALRELAANAIEWGHRHERSRPVHVCGWLEEDRVCVLVRDDGPGFDRYDLPHAARHGDSLSHRDVRSARNLREGGFGILTAGGFVDHLCYSQRGNEALLVKLLPRRPGPARLARAGLAS